MKTGATKQQIEDAYATAAATMQELGMLDEGELLSQIQSVAFYLVTDHQRIIDLDDLRALLDDLRALRDDYLDLAVDESLTVDGEAFVNRIDALIAGDEK